MSMAESASNSLNIHRLRSTYLVPSDHPAPDAIRSRLDSVAQHKFANAISVALSHRFALSAPGVWLIRSLTLNVDLNLDSSEDQMAESWAKQAAISVAKILHENAEADQVLHFSTPAAHLAHFLRDLVEGSAWDKWYYRKFEGMRPLPLSAALRTAISRDLQTGLEALQQMNESATRRVLAALTEHDAKWILNEVTREVSPQHQLDLEQLNPQAVVQCACDGDGEFRAALHLYLRFSKQYPDKAGSQLGRAAISLVSLARCLGVARPQSTLINALVDGDAVALFQLLGPADGERLLPLLGSRRDWLQSIAQAQFPSATKAPSEETRHTAGGGIFLLLPLLDSMPIEAATQHWTALHDCGPASVVRWIILMKCFGTAGAALILNDPLVRDLLGIAPQIDARSLKIWQRTLTRQQLLDFQSHIGRWQIDNAIATGLSVSAFATESQPRLLLCCERQHHSLLLALPDTPSSRQLLLKATSSWPTLANSVDISASDEFQLAGVPLEPADSQQLLRDLDFLRLPTAFSGSQRSELTFSVAARALLRNFSGRLIGFSQSGLEYLFANFLDIPASVQTNSGQTLVRLGRPPLHVVLNLAGMNRQSYTLSWSPGSFALFSD